MTAGAVHARTTSPAARKRQPWLGLGPPEQAVLSLSQYQMLVRAGIDPFLLLLPCSRRERLSNVVRNWIGAVCLAAAAVSLVADLALLASRALH